MYKIYKYTNINNGKVYIGQTSKTLEERALANGINYRECRRFYNAIRKYSWASFVPEILDTVESVEMANEREKYFISYYNSTDSDFGYNIALGGDNKKMSPETCAIISEKAKKRYVNKTTNPMYGRKHSKETLEKQRLKKLGDKNPMYGSRWTETQRAQCSTKGKTLNLTDSHRAKLKQRGKMMGELRKLPVVCIEDDKIFNSMTEAAHAYGVSVSTLCGHIRGYQHTCGGKHFKYANM